MGFSVPRVALCMAACKAVCNCLRRFRLHRRCFCTLAETVNGELLRRMTGMDLDRVFVSQREPLDLPRYKLMDEQQLKKANFEEEKSRLQAQLATALTSSNPANSLLLQAHEEAVSLAKELLKMPPVLPERTPRGEMIERDERLAGATKFRMIFTDITHHKENKSRRVVVREPAGVLREATWQERDRMCQVYFPMLGRKLRLPAMLEPAHLPVMLGKDCHRDILDLVCTQCEPDAADYIRVHHVVYEDIDKRRLYDLLRSTRYFGGMVWYLMSRDRVDNLLRDMLTRQLYSDAADLVELHLLCHPESEFARGLQREGERPTDQQLVEAYCSHHKLTGFRQLLQLHKPEQSRTEATAAS